MKQCNEVFQNFYLRRTKKVTPIAKPQAIMAKRKQEIENQKVINFLCSENGNVQKDKILILCEGYTEVKYFSSLVEKSDGLEKIKIKKGKDVDPLSLIGEAKRYLSFDRTHEKKLSEVWIVFDRDNHYSYQSALEKASRDSQIKVAWSNPCFEFWFLLHFRRKFDDFSRTKSVWNPTTNEFEHLYDSKACLSKLKSCIQGYKKSDTSTFKNLRTRTLKAIENSSFNQSDANELGSSVGLLIQSIIDSLVIQDDFWNKED